MAQLQQTATRVKAPPMTDDLNVLREYVKYLADVVAILGKNLDFIINGNLDANNIRANSIETKNLKAGSVTADKISVNELSAISANLGTINAGTVNSITMNSSTINAGTILGTLIQAATMIGSLIETNVPGVYPRIELSSSSNLLKAERDASNNVTLYAASGGSPQLTFYSAGLGTMSLFQDGGTFHVIGVGNININASSGRVDINAPNGVYANGIRLDVLPTPPPPA